MGAGASTESISNEELKSLMVTVEQMLVTLGETRRKLINAQKHVAFKKHEDILAALCGLSKSVIRRHLLKPAGEDTLTDRDLRDLGGGGVNTYGDFLGRLPLMGRDLKLRDIKVACDGIGMDVDTVAHAFISTRADLIPSLVQDCQDKLQLNMPDLVKKRVSNVPLSIFLQALMTKTGPRTVNGDESSAAEEAAVLTREGVPEGKFILLIVSLSFQQLDRVAAAVGSSLEGVIENRFPAGAMRNYLKAWVQPSVSSAAAEILTQQRSSTQQCMQILSRYDIGALQEIDSIVAQKTGGGILQCCKAALKGKLSAVVDVWMNTGAIDGGAEEKIAECVKNATAGGTKTISDCYNDPDTSVELIMLYQEAADFLQLAVVESDGVSAEEAPMHLSKAKKQKSMRFVEAAPEADTFDTKLSYVLMYLNDVYAAADPDGHGYLTVAKFWRVFQDLDLINSCMLRDELELMPDIVEDDFSRDGYVYWEEVMPEIADNVISALERNDMDPRSSVEEAMAAVDAGVLAAAALDANAVLQQTGDVDAVPFKLAPDLHTYLHRTFDAFDIDNVGSLNRDEFWSFMQLLNLGLVNDGPELEAMMQQLDANEDGMIEWKEAVTQLDNIIHEMASDHRDHWIGLEDTTADPPTCYWYNLLDGTSQWMSEEEQASYQAVEKASGPTRAKTPAGKMGTAFAISRLVNDISRVAERKAIVQNAEDADPAEQEAALLQIDTDYSADVLELKTQLAIAKSLVEQANAENEKKKASRKKSKKIAE